MKLFIEVKRGKADAFLEVISPWEREYLLLNVEDGQFAAARQD